MTEKLTELINTLYEAEGLVEMAIRRKADVSDRVIGLVVNKCYELARIASTIDVPADKIVPSDSDHDSALYSLAEAEDTKEDHTVAEPADEEIAKEKEVEVFTTEILPLVSDEDTVREEEEEEDYDEEDFIDEDIDEEAEEDDTEEIEEEDFIKEDKMAIASPMQPMAPPAKQKPAKPFISLLSINDKFRFRRELFANSDADMRRCFDAIESMSDANDVRRYCFETLGWDPESREVKDFLIIADRFFK